jgi:hypothetical protein
LVNRWSRAVSEEKALHKILNELKIHQYMPALKLLLSVGLQHKVHESFLSITSCPSIIILENTLVYRKKYGYCKFNHWYNVSPIH